MFSSHTHEKVIHHQLPLSVYETSTHQAGRDMTQCRSGLWKPLNVEEAATVQAPMFSKTSQSPTCRSGRLHCSAMRSRPSHVGPQILHGYMTSSGFGFCQMETQDNNYCLFFHSLTHFVAIPILELIPYHNTYLMKYWQTVSMVIEYTVERSVHSIVDIVHQSPVIGPFVFLCKRKQKVIYK